MVDRPRARKLAVRIRQLAAETIERQIKDPRLALVTITDAQVTPDLREAKVFYTVYGDDTAWADSTAALASATGVVRAAVGRALSVRFTPTIEFVADYVPADARRVEDLLAEARAADAVVAQVRTGKEPAGDPDPYRHGDPDSHPDPDADPDSDADSDSDADADSDSGSDSDPGPAASGSAAAAAGSGPSTGAAPSGSAEPGE